MSKPSKLPVNRIVAFAGPYIAIISGALADWLLVHVHFLGIFHTSKTAMASMLTQGVVFALTAVLVWAGHQKWLTGWQLFENAVAGEDVNGPDVPDDLHPSAQTPYDPATAGPSPSDVPGGVPVAADDDAPEFIPGDFPEDAPPSPLSA